MPPTVWFDAQAARRCAEQLRTAVPNGPVAHLSGGAGANIDAAVQRLATALYTFDEHTHHCCRDLAGSFDLLAGDTLQADRW